MTEPRPESESPAPKRRGLWSVMGAPAPTEPLEEAPASVSPQKADAARDDATDHGTAPSDTSGTEDHATESSAAPRQRGLWSMMGKAASAAESSSRETPVISTDASTEASDPPQTDAPAPAPAGRGLFALMQRGAAPDGAAATEQTHAASPVADKPGPELPPDADVDLFDEESDDERTTVEDAAEMRERSAIEPINLEDLEPSRYRKAADHARRQARLALGAGFASALASGLSVLPDVVAGVPAPLLGFVALICGYLVVTGSGRRELAFGTRSAALLGMALGVAGIFLGPLVFVGLGRSWRDTGGTATTQNLARIGTALDACYEETDAYPVGGIFARDESGTIRGQHGWMTALLPYLGEAELHRKIDFSQPYDAEVNRAAMGTNVSVYHAAGADRARIGNGFAVAHFAGIGGEIDDGQGIAHLGIFERDAAVKRDEVTDGLSNTLIVGELAGIFPPWGDPENWRQIGRGLNREVDGFGSVHGRGATFLLGDGSVKFFSNKTDPKLLQKMSTRNGAD